MNPLITNTLILERELEDQRLERLMRRKERDALAAGRTLCSENRVAIFARLSRILKPHSFPPRASCECSLES